MADQQTLERQVAMLTEMMEIAVDMLGTKEFERRLGERRKERLIQRIVLNENEWKEKVAAGDAHAVKKVTKSSYIFARGPGDKPICGPVASVAERERRALVRNGRVGGTCKLNGEQAVLLAAYEDGPAPGKGAHP